MKKLMLATTLLAATGLSSPTWAGGIQIDPTGTANIFGSTFVNTFGDGSTGDLLLSGLSSLGTTGVMYGQNDLDIELLVGGVLVPYELTFVFGRKAEAVDPGFGTNIGLVDRGDTFDGSGTDPLAADFHASGVGFASLSEADGAAGLVGPDSYFEIWLDDTPDASHTLGTGYNNGIRLAAGVISIGADASIGPNGPAGQGAAGTCSGTPGSGAGCLSPGHSNTASNYLTAKLSGELSFKVEFIESLTNTNYVVNPLKTANIDLDISSGAKAPYQQPSGSPSAAANRVGGSDKLTITGHGGTLVGDLGSDGVNNQECIGPGFDSAAGTCSYQVQINSTVTFNAERIPEPGTLALVGSALGLAGWRARRRAA